MYYTYMYIYMYVHNIQLMIYRYNNNIMKLRVEGGHDQKHQPPSVIMHEILSKYYYMYDLRL